jgi:SAM-dependent methyltransferase
VHESVRSHVAAIVAVAGLRSASVLEVGSLNVNGGVRDLFTGEYVGIDRKAGPGVDRVMDAHALGFPDASFDVVVCCEMVEHDDAFWLSLAEIARVLRPGGRLILTTRGNGFPEHSHPNDYWRFMPESVPVLAALAGCEPTAVLADPQEPGFILFGTRVD